MEVREISTAYAEFAAEAAEDIPSGFMRTEAGVIPKNWTMPPLGHLISSVEYGSSAKSKREGKIPVIRMGNLQGGKIDWSDLVYSDNEPEIKKYSLMPGDVLFNRTNTIDLVGKTAIYKGERPAIFAGYLIRINVDESRLDSAFLNYVLNTEHARRYSAKILSIAVGQANINGKKLKTYPIPLPPTKAEQEAIADALSDADALIEVLENLLGKKRQIKQGAMQELLTGNKRLPGFSGEWVVKSFGDIFNFSGGYSASRDQLSSAGHCYLHYGDIHTSNRTFIDIDSGFHDIPKLDVSLKKVSPTSLLMDGDVVFVDASEDDEGTSRHLVVVNPDAKPFISGLHTIVAKAKGNDLDHLYRRYCFQTVKVTSQFRFFSVGTKVSGISKSNIVKVTLSVPPIAEQIAIATILSDMDAEIDALDVRLNKARQLKQGMMQMLLTGRIRLVHPMGEQANG
jgi:type I restriction enzyme S subunit